MGSDILIIDDNPDRFEIFSRQLASGGYNVRLAAGIQKGFDVLFREKIDCILLNWQMPQTSVIEAIERIKSDAVLKFIPVVLLAGAEQERNIIVGLNAGAEDYVSPSGSFELVIARIRAVLERKHLQGAVIQADKTIAQLKEESVKDSLTGLYNHKYFHEVLDVEISRAKRARYNICCCMVDIDCYKQINDNYGHSFGDFILKELSIQMKGCFRQADILVRYGGDEFAVLLADTDYAGAFSAAERFRGQIEAHNFEYLGIKIKLTVSIGISSFFEDELFDKDKFVSFADRALYEAKIRGRNNIVVYREFAAEIFLNAPSLLQMEKRIYSVAEYTKKKYIDSLKILISSWERKRHWTRGHSLSVFKYARLITNETNLPKNEIEVIENAAMLHDLGKLLINEDILFRDKLTQKESEIVKRHPALAVSLLSISGFMKKELPIILYHHECFDGKGYPTGLKGRCIPLGARIIAVADTYENIHSRRLSRQTAIRGIIDELVDKAGTHFDPEIVEMFLKALHKKRFLPSAINLEEQLQRLKEKNELL